MLQAPNDHGTALVMTSGAQVCRHCENQPDGGGRWALIDPSIAAQVTEGQVQPRRQA
jgi:hypothetical protein